jgi:hypothetical protein
MYVVAYNLKRFSFCESSMVKFIANKFLMIMIFVVSSIGMKKYLCNPVDKLDIRLCKVYLELRVCNAHRLRNRTCLAYSFFPMSSAGILEQSMGLGTE